MRNSREEQLHNVGLTHSGVVRRVPVATTAGSEQYPAAVLGVDLAVRVPGRDDLAAAKDEGVGDGPPAVELLSVMTLVAVAKVLQTKCSAVESLFG